MSLKKLSFSILIIYTFLFMISCKESAVSESVNEAEHIAGSYQAIVFMEPGQHDGGIDILASGGKLTVNLSADFELEGHLLIPADIESNYAPTDDNFNGIFMLNSDSLYFKNTGIFFDHDPWMFIVKDTLLETPDWTGRWNIYKIILKKQ